MNKIFKDIKNAMKVFMADVVADKIWNESELKISQKEVGASVELIDADGTLLPAPDGNYEMDNGFKFTVKDGLIESIEGEEPKKDEPVEDAPVEAADAPTEDAPVDEAPSADANKIAELEQKISDLGDRFAELLAVMDEIKNAAPVAASKEDVEAFTKEVSELHESIKRLAKVPVEFSKTTVNNTVKESREDKLIEMAKLLGSVRK